MTVAPWRRFVGRILLGFVAALLITETGARVAEAAGPPALRWYDAATQLKVADMTERRADVVFAGTSQAWQAFDPDTFTAETGLTAYNAGLAGGVPTVMEPWLTEEVVSRLQPDTVVWGLSTLDFAPSFGSENIERYDDALETRSGALATLERAAGVSALVRYRSILRDPDALFGDGRDAILSDFATAQDTMGPGGVRRDFTRDLTERRASTIAARLAGYDLDIEDVTAVIRTVEALRDEGADVVFAELPLPARTTRLHPGGITDLARAHAVIEQLGAELGVEVVDLRAGFSDEDFVDFTHLGVAGVNRITRTLADEFPGGEPADPSPGSVDADAVGRLARRLTNVNDTAFGLLTDRSPASSSELWYLAQHYGRFRDLSAEARSGTSLEVVMMGSSLMVSGGIPSLFTELDGRIAFNAALAATEPTMLAEWTDDVVETSRPDTIVFGVSPLLFRDRTPNAAGCGVIEQWPRAAELRPLVFSGLPDDLRPPDPAQVLVAEADALPYVGPLSRVYDAAFVTMGERRSWPVRTEAEIDQSVGLFSPQVESFAVCDDFVDAFVDSVSRLTRRGIDVVIVSMPISERQASLFPGGRAQLDAALAPIVDAALQAGAVGTLDLSTLLTEDRFRDLRHANREGAELLTRAVVEYLAEIGV